MNKDMIRKAFEIIDETGLPIAVSACLIGAWCRYDGANMQHPAAMELLAQGRVLPLCPEVLGGLTVPRLACERLGQRVVCRDGRDVTHQFETGARLALDMTRRAGCAAALVKARSPSCGLNRVYDGTFKGNLIPGNGFYAALLVKAGIPALTELDLEGFPA